MFHNYGPKDHDGKCHINYLSKILFRNSGILNKLNHYFPTYPHTAEYVLIFNIPILQLWNSCLGTYLSLSSLLGHRPSTSLRQAGRSWASASSCPHVRPIFLISASTSRRKLFRGRPLFLLPCGFHESDSLVMLRLAFLRVWPIHLHRLWRISTSIGCWFVLCHSSWLLICWPINLRLRLYLFCEGRISVLKRRFKTPIQNAVNSGYCSSSSEPERRLYDVI